MKWVNCEDELPEYFTEVLVYVDGHRNPSWSNNYCLVAYLSKNNKWYEERHFNNDPLIGVIKWSYIEYPSKI